jgi:ribonucleoside-diphosphate reductase alpha chain
VHHPDIKYFIEAKNRPDVLNNFYLSVNISREFMQALETRSRYYLYDPLSRQQNGTASAEEIFNAIVESSWENGDPGVVFSESIEKSNPVPQLGRVEMVSGCGEQLMLPLEACFLGSVNVSRMLKEETGGGQRLDWDRLKHTVETGVRFLDNAIDVSKYPGQDIKNMTIHSRKIGLGIMGLASLFYRMSIPYDSPQALDMAERIMKTVKHTAYNTSASLASERGPYPAWRDETRDGIKRRNASLTTIAPTGTLSILAGCSAGIEPVYRLAYIRRIFNSPPLLEVDAEFVSAAEGEGILSKGLIASLVDGQHLNQVKGIPEWMKRVFVTSMDINPDMHLNMQAAIQKYTDNAVSKTVNLPAGATKKAIARIYLEAYRKGLKGVTVYRDSSRPNQPLDTCREGNELVEKWISRQSNPGWLHQDNHHKYR